MDYMEKSAAKRWAASYRQGYVLTLDIKRVGRMPLGDPPYGGN
jgi:hypothetical protein